MQEISIENLLNGDTRALSKAITLIESKNSTHIKYSQELLQKILSKTGKSFRIGISGTPGVGKSTFIEAIGQYLTSLGKKVAVLAVDPSSPLSGGSILGDKTRMEQLSRDKNAFIRPSPTGGNLGGVARKTRETVLLCEAAGYDIILIETVGVGQSEFEVSSMVDFFLLLMQPGSGDELQGIKKGIIELVDSIVINKADGDAVFLAEQTKNQYSSALKIIEGHDSWKPEVLVCSSTENSGIKEVWQLISNFYKQEGKNILLERKKQDIFWMEKLIRLLLENKLENDEAVKIIYKEQKDKLERNEVTALIAAQEVINSLFK